MTDQTRAEKEPVITVVSLAISGFNYLLMKVMVGKMEADLEDEAT